MVDQLCHMVLQNSWRRMKIRCWTRGAGLSPAWLSPWQYCGCTPPGCCRHTTTLPNTSHRAFTTCYLLIPTVAVSAAELCGSRDEDLSSKTRLNNRTNNQQTSHPLQPSSLTTGTNQNGFDGNHIISSPAHANMCKKMFWHGMYFLTGKNSSCSNERFFFPIAALSIFQALQACRRNRT